MNDASELTTRDVLQQVDRRLTSIEEGQRAQSSELRADINALRVELCAEISNSRDELQGVAGVLRTEMSSQFRWIVGLMLGGVNVGTDPSHPGTPVIALVLLQPLYRGAEQRLHGFRCSLTGIHLDVAALHGRPG